MRKPTLSAAVVATTTLLLTAGAGSAANEPAKIDYHDSFTIQEPGRPSGRVFSDVLASPDDPNGKPPAVAHVHTELPAGARYDTGAVPPCTASDVEIMALGPSACPAASRVGRNDVVIDSGAPGSDRYATEDVTFFNERGGMILVSHDRATGANVVLHAKVSGGSFDLDQPPLPGTPPDGGATKSEHGLLLEAAGPGGRSYITTPPTCPASGIWRFRYEYTFRDGRRQTVTSDQPCLRRQATTPRRTRHARRLRVRLRGVPKRCTNASFRVRIKVSGGAALRRVSVRVDGRRVATRARRSFRQRIAAAALRSGRHRLSVRARDRAAHSAVRTAFFKRC